MTTKKLPICYILLILITTNTPLQASTPKTQNNAKPQKKQYYLIKTKEKQTNTMIDSFIQKKPTHITIDNIQYPLTIINPNNLPKLPPNTTPIFLCDKIEYNTILQKKHVWETLIEKLKNNNTTNKNNQIWQLSFNDKNQAELNNVTILRNSSHQTSPSFNIKNKQILISLNNIPKSISSIPSNNATSNTKITPDTYTSDSLPKSNNIRNTHDSNNPPQIHSNSESSTPPPPSLPIEEKIKNTSYQNFNNQPSNIPNFQNNTTEIDDYNADDECKEETLKTISCLLLVSSQEAAQNWLNTHRVQKKPNSIFYEITDTNQEKNYLLNIISPTNKNPAQNFNYSHILYYEDVNTQQNNWIKKHYEQKRTIVQKLSFIQEDNTFNPKFTKKSIFTSTKKQNPRKKNNSLKKNEECLLNALNKSTNNNIIKNSNEIDENDIPTQIPYKTNIDTTIHNDNTTTTTEEDIAITSNNTEELNDNNETSPNQESGSDTHNNNINKSTTPTSPIIAKQQNPNSNDKNTQNNNKISLNSQGSISATHNNNINKSTTPTSPIIAKQQNPSSNENNTQNNNHSKHWTLPSLTTSIVLCTLLICIFVAIKLPHRQS